jgi:acetyl esterase/lipase
MSTDPVLAVAREDLTLVGTDGTPRPAYLYWPEHPGGATCVFVDGTDDLVSRLCVELQCVVLSVSRGHGLDDVVAALEWARENLPGRPFLVGGHGAGSALVRSACQQLDDGGLPLPDLQLLPASA